MQPVLGSKHKRVLEYFQDQGRWTWKEMNKLVALLSAT